MGAKYQFLCKHCDYEATVSGGDDVGMASRTTTMGVDGLNAAIHLREHHYASFSLAHSYAARVANRDVLWWTDADGRHGINVLGTLEVAE